MDFVRSAERTIKENIDALRSAERTIQGQIAQMETLQGQFANLQGLGKAGYTDCKEKKTRKRANAGGHGCTRLACGKYVFFTRKEGFDDFPWNKLKENCPRNRVIDFCPNCRQIDSKSKKNDRWECMCS